MSLYIIKALTITVLCLPLAVVAIESFRLRHSLTSAVLSILYVTAAFNELLFIRLGNGFYVFHILLDGIIISIGAVFLLIAPKYGKPTVPNEFMFHYGFLYLGMLGISFLSLIQPDGGDQLGSVEAVLVFLFTLVVLLQARRRLFSVTALLLLLWFVSHCCVYSIPPRASAMVTCAFFCLLTLVILWNAYKDHSRMYFENRFLFRSRDTVLSMLNEVSSSKDYISSVQKTMQRVLDSIAVAMSVKGVALYVRSPGHTGEPELRYVQSAGTFLPLSSDGDLPKNLKKISDTRLAKKTFRPGEGLIGRVAETGRPVMLNRGPDYYQMASMGINPRTIHNVCAVAFETKGLMKGVMVVENNNKAAFFNESDLHLLKALAEQAGVLIGNTRMYMDMARARMFKQEADIARNIERQMLPEKVPEVPNLTISVMIEPAREVGGDYYDFVRHGDGTLGIVIGDVSGKGVPAGMMVAIAKAILRLVATLHHTPGEIVSRFRREINQHILDRQFMTLCYLRWLSDTRTMQFVGAGHGHLLWFHKSSGRIEKMRAGGIAIGLTEKADDLGHQVDLAMEPGDVLLLYTDGIIDARNTADDLYSLRRLQAALATYAGILDPKKIRDHIMKDVLDFMGGAEQYDDMILMVLSVVA